MPTRERGRPARTFARHSLGHLRHWDRPATAPCPSFGLAIAVHAGWGAARRQPCATAPFPPARNKVAGGTPAFPGGRRGFPWDLPLRVTSKGRLPARKVVPTLRNLHQKIWLRAGRPRSRGGRRWFPWDLPLRVTSNGRLPARKVLPTLHNLHQEIRLRARRPRSRGGAVGFLGTCPCGSPRKACCRPARS